MKVEGYGVEYDEAGSHQYIGRVMTTDVTISRPSEDAESEEWIMMQDNPKDLSGQRVKSGV